jgi:4-guanidinobutyraldehyde dehydrogenase / NAD-dependent aldehyde dehydrogenase
MSQSLGHADWIARAGKFAASGLHFIDGRTVPSISGASFDCLSPIDGRLLGKVAAGESADVDAAVASARRAFGSGAWSRATALLSMWHLQPIASSGMPRQ